MNSELVTQVGTMVFLVAMSAYFSASETAFSCANKNRLRTMADEGSRKAKVACSLAEQYDKLISTILIGNNIVNIALASIGTLFFIKLYGQEMGATVSSAVITIVVLIFGEISPKSIAKDCPEKFALFSTPLMQLLVWILTPVCFIFSMWKKLLSKIMHLESHQKISQAELLMFVDEVQQGGALNQNDGELLRNAIEFSERTAKDILTPRVKLEGVPLDCPKEEIAQRFYETKFSRLLVYEGNIDKIVGVIHQKCFYVGTGITQEVLKDIISPVIFVMETEKISTLMKKLQQKQAQVAVVLDEFGGTRGIVTMEDVLEELVGDIWDEHDDVVLPFQKLSEGRFRVNATVNLEDFCDYFKVKIESEMVSLNGWVQEHFHTIHKVGDKFEYEFLAFRVLSTDHHRISMLEVILMPEKMKEEKA